MKKVISFMIMVVALIFLIACNQKSKQQNENSLKTVKDTINWSGTYEGIVPMKDVPDGQLYVLLALDDDGHYEMFKKMIGHIGAYASKGDAVWNKSQDSLKFSTDEDFCFQISENTLQAESSLLRKISNKKNLDDVYFFYTIKHNKTGNNYAVKIYSQENSEYAVFEFNGKAYYLTRDTDNTQELEFADGSVSLIWNIEDPAPLADYNPVFINGKERHEFTILSPSNTIYKAKKESAPATLLDVLYFNSEGRKSLVKIMNNSIRYCYTLEQTEASAKTSNYENSSVQWLLDNKREAVLVINGNKYEYAE